MFIGHQMVNPITFRSKGHVSFTQIYDRPLFSIQGLYKQNGIKNVIGFLKSRENIKGKVDFLEDYLDKTDKSGYQPKDMIVKNDRLRLKLLENHYKEHIDYYGIKFRF